MNGFAAHVDFENDCSQCHAPLVGIAPARCEACHTSVGQERANGTGLHGRLKPQQARECGTCHRDHQGRDFDLNAAALKTLDHAGLGFSLVHHIVSYDSAPIACQACHLDTNSPFTPLACIDCHAGHDRPFITAHMLAFGTDCQNCHDGVDRTTGFDHSQTRFPLLGQHAGLECSACHRAKTTPEATTTKCAGCHAEPAAHAGVFANQDCGACHTVAGWSPAQLPANPSFRHATTAFSLSRHTRNYDGTDMRCTACHSQAAKLDFQAAAQACQDCHQGHDTAFMQEHVQQYGPNCLSCHDGAGNMHNFDHSRVFALDGGHASLECAACHVDHKFQGTPRACAACHQEPEIHAGLFGTECQNCHTTTAWAPAQLTRHTFPLDHGQQGEQSCATCHTQTYTAYTCYGCHDHNPQETQAQHAEKGITGEALLKCADCHAAGKVQGDN